MHKSLIQVLAIVIAFTITWTASAQIGKVGINTNIPAAMLHVLDSSVVFTGPGVIPATGNPPVSGAGSRMMWYANKAAFRAGNISVEAAPFWNKDSIGLYSVALGFNTKAKGEASIAAGYATAAIGTRSIALGAYTIASGYYSTALGNNTKASDYYSTAMGDGTMASGSWSTAMGNFTIASGAYSTALGSETIASGGYSTSIGYNTEASGQYSTTMGEGTMATSNYSTAMGYFTKASNHSSTAMGFGSIASGFASNSFGFNTKAKAHSSFVIGAYNDTTVMSPATWFPSDPLFIIGKGTDNTARSNAMTVLKNGKTGINTHAPVAMLHVKDSSVVFTGPLTLPGPSNLPISGAGTRMLWYADKAAFRAGKVTGNEWNKDSIGLYSAAFGYDTKAKGQGSIAGGLWTSAIGYNSTSLGLGSIASGSASTAIGYYTTASGLHSTAMGEATMASGSRSTALGSGTIASGIISTTLGSGTMASGDYSTSMGYSTKASGDASHSFGSNTKASGDISNSFGIATNAKAYGSFVLGRYNDTTAISSTGWNTSDPLFIIGNGSSEGSRANAITVLKNGNVGIGSDVTPSAILHVSKGNGGGMYNSNSAVIIEDNGTSYIQFSNPNNTQCGILSGNSDDDIRSSILFFADSSITFRAGGDNTRATIENNGYFGIGTVSPDYLLEVNGTAGKPGGGSWTNTSDVRLKQNIHPYTDGLESVLKINPITYQYNISSGYDTKPEYVGVVAQELKEIAPYMVSESNKKTEDGVKDYLSVDNSAMTYMLINAVKELQILILNQQQKIEQLELQLSSR